MNSFILTMGKLAPYVFVGIILFEIITPIIYRNKEIPRCLGLLLDYLEIKEEIV